jgi:hypothetical protein
VGEAAPGLGDQREHPLALDEGDHLRRQLGGGEDHSVAGREHLLALAAQERLQHRPPRVGEVGGVGAHAVALHPPERRLQPPDQGLDRRLGVDALAADLVLDLLQGARILEDHPVDGEDLGVLVPGLGGHEALAPLQLLGGHREALAQPSHLALDVRLAHAPGGDLVRGRAYDVHGPEAQPRRNRDSMDGPKMCHGREGTL